MKSDYIAALIGGLGLGALLARLSTKLQNKKETAHKNQLEEPEETKGNIGIDGAEETAKQPTVMSNPEQKDQRSVEIVKEKAKTEMDTTEPRAHRVRLTQENIAKLLEKNEGFEQTYSSQVIGQVENGVEKRKYLIRNGKVYMKPLMEERQLNCDEILRFIWLHCNDLDCNV